MHRKMQKPLHQRSKKARAAAAAAVAWVLARARVRALRARTTCRQPLLRFSAWTWTRLTSTAGMLRAGGGGEAGVEAEGAVGAEEGGSGEGLTAAVGEAMAGVVEEDSRGEGEVGVAACLGWIRSPMRCRRCPAGTMTGWPGCLPRFPPLLDSDSNF